MLEILGIYYLCRENRKNALARGRKPGLFTALTIVMWFGFELTAIILSVLVGLEGYAIYIPGLMGALLGGLFSYLIAKNCRKGSYVSPEEKMVQNVQNTAEMLSVPATVEIVRKSSFVGALAGYPLILNGQAIGTIQNGKTITAVTNQSQNLLGCSDTYGQSLKPVIFTVGNGSHVLIECKPGKLLLTSVSGGTPVPASASVPPPASVPAAPKSASVQFCRSCGAKVTKSGDYCINCGANL